MRPISKSILAVAAGAVLSSTAFGVQAASVGAGVLSPGLLTEASQLALALDLKPLGSTVESAVLLGDKFTLPISSLNSINYHLQSVSFGDAGLSLVHHVPLLVNKTVSFTDLRFDTLSRTLFADIKSGGKSWNDYALFQAASVDGGFTRGQYDLTASNLTLTSAASSLLFSELGYLSLDLVSKSGLALTNWGSLHITAAPIPEPSTAALLGLGLVALAGVRAHRR